MHVQHIELFVIGYFRHLRCQRQRVRWIGIEERIRRDGDFVKVNALVEDVEARGERIADEMDVVASPGQGYPKLRGHHAGAAEGRIAGNSDSHQTSRPL